jgi:hypothetical protein
MYGMRRRGMAAGFEFGWSLAWPSRRQGAAGVVAAVRVEWRPPPSASSGGYRRPRRMAATAGTHGRTRKKRSAVYARLLFFPGLSFFSQFVAVHFHHSSSSSTSREAVDGGRFARSLG